MDFIELLTLMITYCPVKVSVSIVTHSIHINNNMGGDVFFKWIFKNKNRKTCFIGKVVPIYLLKKTNIKQNLVAMFEQVEIEIQKMIAED